MSDALALFCERSRSALGAMETEAALTQIARRLAELCADPAFVRDTFGEDDSFGRRELYRDATYDFRVLAHVQAPAKKGKPHDHGASWAVYGTAKGVTRMTDWRRVGDDPDHVVLEPVRVYDLRAGEAHFFGPHVLHSTEHPEKTWVIRVTGTDLDAIPRYHFRSKSDRMLEQA